ncbi:MAG: FecR domain-containing protein [Cyclobacteriaceae bacterium]
MKNNPDQVKEILLAKELILKLDFNNKEADQEQHDRVLSNILKGDYSSKQRKSHNHGQGIFQLKRYFQLAAVVILAWFLYVMLFSISNISNKDTTLSKNFVVKENPSGRKSQIFLPDGSAVWLNAESKIEYLEDKVNNRRLVKLAGEAFFDVAKDHQRAFVVTTSNCSITAVGTQFNVRAFPEDIDHKISLHEGIVSVKFTEGEGLLLNPSEAVNVSKVGGIGAKTIFNPKSDLDWKVGLLYFENASFPAVIRKLERWYGMQFIVIGKDRIGKWEFSSEFHNETLVNVLETISYAKGFKYQIDEKTVKLIF